MYNFEVEEFHTCYAEESSILVHNMCEGGSASLTKTQIEDIINVLKGSRPDPSTYLSQDYIDEHLVQFDHGASIIMTKEQYIKYVKENENFGIPSDGTQFVMTKNFVMKLH